jgi:nucleoside-diphosphate-sugar epimerase
VAALLRESGVGVRALHRSSSDVTHLDALGCELVEGDVRDGPEALARAMRGCDAVVHAASFVYADVPWPRIRAVNVEGTEAVFQGALGAGVRRAVHLSSVAVYGMPGRGEVDESFPLDRPLRPGQRYARSKREAEARVRRAARGSELRVAILRPAALYGERDRLLTPRLARNLERIVQVLLGSGRTALPAVYAGNLAAAVERGLRAPLPVGVRVFNVATDFPVTQRDLYLGLAAVLGKRPRFLPLPGVLVRGAARAVDGLGVPLPGFEEGAFSRAARLATRPNPYRTGRIREELGWEPPVGAEEAMRRTAQWLDRERTHGA